MRRRDVLGAVAGAGAWPLGLHAQQTARVARIGYLTATFEDQSFAHVFRQTLYSLGSVEGQNVAIEYRFAEGDFGRLPQLAAELVESRVDLIVATPTAAV